MIPISLTCLHFKDELFTNSPDSNATCACIAEAIFGKVDLRDHRTSTSKLFFVSALHHAIENLKSADLHQHDKHLADLTLHTSLALFDTCLPMSRYHYPVPADEVVFEELIRDLFNAERRTDTFELYKHRGSNQFGIDIFSRSQGVVIQCKKKDPARKDTEIRNELKADLRESVTKAHGFPFDFTSFVFATTSKKYSDLQDLAIALTGEYPFDVRLLAWADIERLLDHQERVRARYFPSFTQPPHRQKVSSGSDHLSAYGQSTRRDPIPGTIGRNSTLKSSIEIRFHELGEERAKRFGQSAYPVMYRNFKTDFGIAKQPWTCIWDWPEACAPAILGYLEAKWRNTIAGRREAKLQRGSCLPTRPQLFAEESDLLKLVGLKTDSIEVRGLLERWFGVKSHRDLSDLQHWHFVLQLTEWVKDRTGI